MATLEWLRVAPPWLWYFALAALIPLLPQRLRVYALLSAPILGMVTLSAGVAVPLRLFEWELVLYRVDALNYVFLLIFNIAALLGGIYACRIRDTLQQVSALLYAGSALGAVGAGDWISLFVFWEFMALTSFFLICATRTHAAWRAGLRYLVVHIASGFLLLIGLLLHLQQADSILLDESVLYGASAWWILAAVGIKCAFPLLHSWLIDAYPQATPAAAVFLSAFTTKAAIYLLLRLFPGTEALIYIGAFMTCAPLFLAMLENDLRRVLCYSMISQLGFMVCGAGVGSMLAIDGATAHAFNDILFKGLLFMNIGAVLHVTGSARASDLGGLHRRMPQTALLCIIGAAAISALPPFGSFVSKSMIMSAVLKDGHSGAWLALLFAAAAAPVYIGIRIPWLAFYAPAAVPRTDTGEAPLNMRIAMAVTAALCLFAGCFPGVLQALLPYQVHYAAYDLSHVLAQVQLLAFSGLTVVWLIRVGGFPSGVNATVLDTDWVYRRGCPRLFNIGVRMWSGGIGRHIAALRRRAADYMQDRLRACRQADIPNCFLDTGIITGLSAGLLTGFLLLYYLILQG